MGVVNVTPDSFSDGGQWFDHARAVDHGLDLFVCGDQLLKGAALNAVQIAELVPALKAAA